MTGYIIGGVTRAGKTALAERLHQEKGISIISHDWMISAFQHTLPQLSIRHGGEADNGQIMLPFITHYLAMHSDWGRYSFIFDTAYLSPRQIIEAGFDKKYKVVFLGYADISAGEKFDNIRNHARPYADWTADHTDEELMPMVEEMIINSKMVKQQCDELGITYFDTSVNFKEKLNSAYHYLTSQTEK